MIHTIVIVRTPFRASFFGGGTDYPDYYLRNGGQVLATSIGHYGYITLNRMTDLVEDRFRLNYSIREAVQQVGEIRHPVVRACFETYKVDQRINLTHTADLPAKSGLGSSSAFAVGLIHALHTFYHRAVSQEKVALEAIHLEQDILKERVGSQDQYITAMGGLRHIRFHRDGSINSNPVIIRPDRFRRLEGNLLLFYTNITRYASEVLDEQLVNTKKGALDSDLEELGGLVNQGRAILEGERALDEFGELLHTGWEIKKRLSSKIVNPNIDDAYGRARKAGAIGGKLLGAGGGGFLLFYVPEAKQDAVRKSLAGLVEVPFKFDTSGSTILYIN